MANRNYPKNVTATTVIPFDNPVTYIPPKTVTGALTFTKTTTGAQAGYASIIRVIANGTNTPDLSAFKAIGTGTWDNTSGVVNQLWFVFDGVDYCVAITHPVTVGGGGGGGDTTAPTVVSATATDATHFTVVFSETVVPTVAGWSVQDGTTLINYSPATVSGSGTTWIFVLGSGSMPAGNPLNLSYNSGTGNTVDTSANEVVSFSGFSMTNSIGPALEAVNFNLHDANLVNDGSGNWAASGAGFGKVGTQTTKKLAAGNDGYIEFNYSASDCDFAIVGFTSGTTLISGYTAATFYAIFTNSGNLSVINAGTNTAVGPTITAATGKKLRVERAGSVVKAKYYDGATWSDVFTFNTTTHADLLGDLLPACDSQGTAVIRQPKAYNLT